MSLNTANVKNDKIFLCKIFRYLEICPPCFFRVCSPNTCHIQYGSNVFKVITSNGTVEIAPRRLTEEPRDCVCTESNLHVSCTERYTGSVNTSQTESKQCTKSCMPACQATACILWLSKKLHVTFKFLLLRYISLNKKVAANFSKWDTQLSFHLSSTGY